MNNLKMYAIIVVVSLAIIFFGIGMWYGNVQATNQVHGQISAGIEKCESQGQVFRMYKDGDSVKAMCYGEEKDRSITAQWG